MHIFDSELRFGTCSKLPISKHTQLRERMGEAVPVHGNGGKGMTNIAKTKVRDETAQGRGAVEREEARVPVVNSMGARGGVPGAQVSRLALTRVTYENKAFMRRKAGQRGAVVYIETSRGICAVLISSPCPLPPLSLIPTPLMDGRSHFIASVRGEGWVSCNRAQLC